jgi:diguanylate cyclase (GGDEF)-like protein/PAS domain S-box-containing protein
MELIHLDPNTDTRPSFGETHDAVVYAVRGGKVDAGTVRTDTLERMADEGAIDLADFRVINQAPTLAGSGFPFLRSTPLYPEWPFAALASTPEELSQTVAIALMSMPLDSEAARASVSAGWGVPLNYQPVHDLLKRLRTGIYADFGKITLRDVLLLYWHWILVGAILLFTMAFATAYVFRLNAKLRYSRGALREAKDELEVRVEERTSKLAETNRDLEQEIEERKLTERRLKRLSREKQLLLDSAGEGIFGVDKKGNLIFINPHAMRMLRRSEEELMGDSMHQLTHHTKVNGDPYPRQECPVHSTMKYRETRRITDEVFWRGDGTSFPVEYTSTPLMEENELVGAVVVFKDITAQKQSEAYMRQIAVVFETTAEGILITDEHNRIITVNSAFTGITGYSKRELVGINPSILSSKRYDQAFYEAMWSTILGTGHWRGEIWNRRKNGEIYPEWLSVNVVRNEQGEITNFIGVFTDISAVKESEERLEYLAYHDPLTNLPNRLLFQDRLTHALQLAQRNESRIGIMFLDLDRFKEVNDTLGHQAGDTLLETVSERLQRCLREQDTVARIGGDEFMVIMENISDAGEIEPVAEKILRELELPVSILGEEVVIHASIGISIYPEDGKDCQTLIKRADSAMYAAKEQGRNRYQYYDAALEERSS